MPKVYNRKNRDEPKGAVYVGRPSIFGNPYVIGRDGTRDEVVEKFKQTIICHELYLERVRKELKGKDLVCWCAPEACHADVLLEIANEDGKS